MFLFRNFYKGMVNGKKVRGRRRYQMTENIIQIRLYAGTSTSQTIGARNEWFWMIMMVKWYSGNHGGLKLPDICLTGEKKTREKSYSGNLSRAGIEPWAAAWQARILPPAPPWWAVEWKCWVCSEIPALGQNTMLDWAKDRTRDPWDGSQTC